MRYPADDGDRPAEENALEESALDDETRRPYRKPKAESRGRITPSLLGSPPPPPGG